MIYYMYVCYINTFYIRTYTHETFPIITMLEDFRAVLKSSRTARRAPCKFKQTVVPDPTGQVSAQVGDTKRQEVDIPTIVVDISSQSC